MYRAQGKTGITNAGYKRRYRMKDGANRNMGEVIT